MDFLAHARRATRLFEGVPVWPSWVNIGPNRRPARMSALRSEADFRLAGGTAAISQFQSYLYRIEHVDGRHLDS
jgi:hypothetical protein